MALTQVPALDQNVCSGWSEQDISLYNRLPYHLAELQVEHRKTWAVWSRFCGKRRWIPNQGDTLKGVRKDMSPHLRQFLFPNAIAQMPKKDVVDVREVTTQAQVYKHRFETQNMNFVPSFRDFLTDHVEFHMKDILEKQQRAEDVFLRGNIWANSPFVFTPDAAGGEAIAAPTGPDNATHDAPNSKSIAWLKNNIIGNIGNPGNLHLLALNNLLNFAETNLRAMPFSGPITEPKENQGMANKFVLLCSSEAYNQFSFDPWLVSHKNANLDIVQDRFYGNLFGRISCRIEDYPIRIGLDANGNPTFPAPETREGNPSAWNYQETVPNPAYTDLSKAPWEVAWFIGAEGYEAIEVGPPPSIFASNGMPKGFGKMFWNGEVQITKNILLQCVDETGAVQYDTNAYGEYLKLISQTTYGILPIMRRNIIPIIFKRKRGAGQPIIPTSQGQW